MRVQIVHIALAVMVMAGPAGVPAMASLRTVPNAATIATTPANSARTLYGFVISANAGTIVVRDRAGRLHTVDVRRAYGNVWLTPGRPVIANGVFSPAGVLIAHSIWRTFPDAAHWPADR